MKYDKLAKAIVTARKASGFPTTAALAEKIRIARSTVARWEAGEKAPTPLHLERLLKSLAQSQRQQVASALFSDFPTLLASLTVEKEQEEEIDDTNPEIRSILNHVQRLSTESPECAGFVTLLGRMFFRPQPEAASDNNSPQRVRRLFLALAEFGQVAPGTLANEVEAFRRVSQANQ